MNYNATVALPAATAAVPIRIASVRGRRRARGNFGHRAGRVDNEPAFPCRLLGNSSGVLSNKGANPRGSRGRESHDRNRLPPSGVRGHRGAGARPGCPEMLDEIFGVVASYTVLFGALTLVLVFLVF
jgi:hypothetical protein